MPSEIGSVTTRDGVSLRTRRWEPSEEPWAGLLIVHGLGEHTGRYERTGSILAAAGILVHGWDLRGFGGSGGPHCHVERWEDHLDDMEAALDRLRIALPGRPAILLGHSMGGLIALDQVISGRPRADLLVLSAPAVTDALAPWKHRLVPILDRILPRLRLPSGITSEDVCRDPAQAAADACDPLVDRSGSVRLGRFGFDAQRRVAARLAALERMPTPTLVVHGADDTVIPVASSEAIGRLDGVTRRVLPGLRHEVFNEPEGPEVVTEVVTWIGERVDARTQTVVEPVRSGVALPGAPATDGPELAVEAV